MCRRVLGESGKQRGNGLHRCTPNGCAARVGAVPGSWGRRCPLPAHDAPPGDRRGVPATLGAVQPQAVVDIGSNSSRLIVAGRTDAGHLEVIADARAALRLVRHLGSNGELDSAGIASIIASLHSFMTIAEAAGAKSVTAVATAAIREATNRDEVLNEIQRATGVRPRVLDGSEEAILACHGAIRALPVESGAVLDIGGGSLEIATFRDRRHRRDWSFPLGALRMNDLYLVSDPPKRSEIAACSEMARAELIAAEVGGLPDGDTLVGTGGTVRAVARVARARRPGFINRLHGATLTADEISSIVEDVCRRPSARRAAIPGLSADRVDSIAGGVLVLQAVMDHLQASEIVVAGQGLREGMMLASREDNPPPAAAIRTAAVEALSKRFSSWSPERADWRRALARALTSVLEADINPATAEALDHAAVLLDIGRSIDYYNRYLHAAHVVVAADLAGFAHREVGRLAAIIEKAGRDRSALRHYRPLLTSSDLRGVERAAIILVIADALERRTHPVDRLSVSRRDKKSVVCLSLPLAIQWDGAEISKRFRRVFGMGLVIAPSTSGTAVSVDIR